MSLSNSSNLACKNFLETDITLSQFSNSNNFSLVSKDNEESIGFADRINFEEINKDIEHEGMVIVIDGLLGNNASNHYNHREINDDCYVRNKRWEPGVCDIGNDEFISSNIPSLDVRENQCIVCGDNEKTTVFRNLDEDGESDILTIFQNILSPDIYIFETFCCCFVCYEDLIEIGHLQERVETKREHIHCTFKKFWDSEKISAKMIESSEHNDSDVAVLTLSEGAVDSENASCYVKEQGDKDSSIGYCCLNCHDTFNCYNEMKSHMSLCKLEKISSKRTFQIGSEVPHVSPYSSNGKMYSKNVSTKFKASSKLRNTYDCHVCDRFLTTQARLETHLFKYHGIGEAKNNKFECKDCSKSFGTKPGLRYHTKVSHQMDKKYTCPHCTKVYYHYDPFKSHVLFAHGEKNIPCDSCEEKFFTVSKLNTHINLVHREASSWQCKICNIKFTDGMSLKRHIAIKHLDHKFMCDKCPAGFRKQVSLYSHLIKHDIFKCKVCNKTLAAEKDFVEHMLKVHNRTVPLSKVKSKPNACKKRVRKVKTPKSKSAAKLKSSLVTPKKVEHTERAQNFVSNVRSNLYNNDQFTNTHVINPDDIITNRISPSIMTSATLPLMRTVGFIDDISLQKSVDKYVENDINDVQNHSTVLLEDKIGEVDGSNSIDLSLPRSLEPACPILQASDEALSGLQGLHNDSVQNTLTIKFHSKDGSVEHHELIDPAQIMSENHHLSCFEDATSVLEPDANSIDDDSNMWMKESSWALIKDVTPGHTHLPGLEILSNEVTSESTVDHLASQEDPISMQTFQNLPSSDIVGLDIDVIGSDMNDVIVESNDAMDLVISGTNKHL